MRCRTAPQPSRPGRTPWLDWKKPPVWHATNRGRALAPKQIMLAVSEQSTTALNEVRRQGLTLNTLIQTAWAILLGRLLGRGDVVFGVTVSGRPPEVAGIERMVGLFINTLPLRIKLPPAKPLLDLLKEVQDSQSKLIAHQHLGLAEIQSAAGLGELFDTLVVFENYPLDETSPLAESGGLRLARVSGHDATHYPLALMAIPGGQLRLRFDYRPDLFDRATVEAIAGRFVRLLEATVAHPDRAIGSLDILSGEERASILRGWNDTAHALSAATLPELFAAQVARRPDAIAVVFEDESLSYGALDRRANRLAHHLRALGVGPETVVGLCLARSLDMIVGLIGILKAGGAYVPLDPEYPIARLEYMVAEAGLRLLLTQSSLASSLNNSRRSKTRTARSRGHDRAARYSSIHQSASRTLGLFDLYLGIDREAEGGGKHTWRSAQSVELDAERLPADARRRCPAEDALQF